MESTNQLCQRWLNEQARTAALDEMIHDVKRHCALLEENLHAYQLTTEQVLNILNLPESEMSKDEKLLTVKELLGLVYSGQILQAAEFMQVPPLETAITDLTEGLVMQDEFEVYF